MLLYPIADCEVKVITVVYPNQNKVVFTLGGKKEAHLYVYLCNQCVALLINALRTIM